MSDLAASLIKLVTQFGALGLLLTLALSVLLYPEKAERVSGWLLGWFTWTGKAIRQRSIAASIQGRISDFARSLNREAEGSLPYNMRLRFVSDNDLGSLSPDADTVIVRIRNRGDKDKNLVHAMLAFAPVGCVPLARPYLQKALSRAIDVTLTRRLLISTRHLSALQYLPLVVDEGSPGDGREELDQLCSTLTTLDERGIFTRALLAELRDLGALIHTQHPTAAHASEVSAFVDYLTEVAAKKPHENLRHRGYRGQYISTAFVFVGRLETMQESGEKRYLDHLRSLRDRGYQRAFLAARSYGGDEATESFSATTARRVALQAEQTGLAEKVQEMDFLASDPESGRRPHLLIELALLPP